ncbi:MAG: D-2-hydroxyacid dehydrogenase [Anaerolineales bacterium]
MPKLLILAQDADAYRALLQAQNLPDLEVLTQPEESCEMILGAPNLIPPLLNSLPNLRWVQSTWAGVEPLLDSALRRDYILTNARGVFGGLMSEFVFGHLLFYEKRIAQHQQAQREKRWAHEEIGMLRGKTLGLLGVGSIGAHVAGTAKRFGMTVRGYTRGSEDCQSVDEYFHGGRLLEFARGLNNLVCVLPRTPETNQIVNAAVLSELARGAIFINVGRANAVEEGALLNALRTGGLSAAVLDVFDREPLPPDHPFWTTPHLQMTFHTSAHSYPQDIARVFADNYRLYLAGLPLQHRVDFERGY